jgi:RNA polymerase sigma factor (sigma-70 family)
MAEVPTTRVSLLVRIRDLRDNEAWSEFVETYGPVVYDYGRRHGLQHSDAADLTQDVLRAVAGTIGNFHYDPQRGSFRSWLFTVARTKRLNLVAQLTRNPQPRGDAAMVDRLNEVVATDDRAREQAEWNRAFEQRLLDRVAPQVRGEVKEATWQAFWRTAVEGANPETVAKDLGLTVGAVYAARCRILARLRDQIRQLGIDQLDE